MQYMGAKTRLAKQITNHILLNSGGKARYVEPFLGGASIAESVLPFFRMSAVSDGHPDLMAMWKAAVNDWNPPTVITEEDYYEAKNLPTPDPVKGFVGFGCSFGAKWFGGYARNAAGANYAARAAASVIRKASVIAKSGSSVNCLDYKEADVDRNTVVYCDPPYLNTQPYRSMSFDHVSFWSTCKEWASCGATVIVSEYSAPLGAELIAEFEHVRKLNKNERTPTKERLFLVNAR